MTLREARAQFTVYLATLLTQVNAEDGVDLVLDEGRVFEKRKGLLVTDGTPVETLDRVHKHGSYHYIGLAADLNLYIDGRYIDRANPLWTKIGTLWKGMDKRNKWGGDWESRDLNHFSFDPYPDDGRA